MKLFHRKAVTSCFSQLARQKSISAHLGPASHSAGVVYPESVAVVEPFPKVCEMI